MENNNTRHSFRHLIFLVLLLALFTSNIKATANSEDLNFILSGVNKIWAVGNPGVLSVYDQEAFPICVGDDNGIRKPIIAGIRYGQGKVVAFGHTNLLFSTRSDFDNARLMLNIINWLGESSPVTTAGLYLYDNNQQDMQVWLPGLGITPTSLQGSNLSNSTFLSQFDVLMINKPDNWEFNGGSEAIKSYLKSGGNLILGATPWSWSPPEGWIFRTHYWGNRVIGDMGTIFLPWSYGYPTISNGFNTSQQMLTNTHSGTQLIDDLRATLESTGGSIDIGVANQMLAVLRDTVGYALERSVP